MKINFIFSSSDGNCSVVESETGTRIAIDAGVSYKKLIDAYGELLTPDALFITHEHGDHTAGAGVLARKTQCPVYIPEKSFEKVSSVFKKCDQVSFVKGGQHITVGDLEIEVFSTQHDAKESVGYIIKEGPKKFGYLTDSGNISRLMRLKLQGCNAYFIEADYETDLLWAYEEYTTLLKERIACDFGHLSNDQTLDYIQTLDLDSLEWIVLGHLSKRTNSPELLTKKFSERFPNYVSKLRIAPLTEQLTL